MAVRRSDMQMFLLALLAISVPSLAGGTTGLPGLERDLQAILEEMSNTWNCTFSVAARAPALGDAPITAASRDATSTSRFAWGSITKMWTGASIMQLVAKGILKLEEPMAPHLDAQLKAMADAGFPGMQKFRRASDLWGEQVNTVTIRDLLAMQSGIPDFDTANPNPHGPDLDPFRASVYAQPSRNFLEPELMSEPWVATHNLTSTPGQGFHYSSTNFGILGLMLSQHAAVTDYTEFNQSTFIPQHLNHVLNSMGWAPTGSPREHGVYPGFDRTDYNGQNTTTNPAGVPVVGVAGVFAGYAAADFVGSPSAVAELGWALWGSGSELMPAGLRDLMVPANHTFYGLASQNVGLMGIAGGKDEYSIAYGHLGATYGYDSIFGYNPTLDLGVAIASNIETPTQTQPSDVFCHVYNRIKNFMKRETVQKCEYKSTGYYGGECVCK